VINFKTIFFTNVIVLRSKINGEIKFMVNTNVNFYDPTRLPRKQKTLKTKSLTVFVAIFEKVT